MAERDQQDDPEVRESVDAFRRAVVAASDGVRTLPEWGHDWAERRHPLVQFTLVGTVWFAGNWLYNRIAPSVITVITTLAEEVLVGVVPLVSFLGRRPVVVSAQILLLLIVVVVAQNWTQTRKLKTIESKVTTMSNESREATDGGTPVEPGPREWTVCGVICGAILGISFGPGGVLAGMYLGFWIGGKVDRRVYENDPLTPGLNAESSPEQ